MLGAERTLRRALVAAAVAVVVAGASPKASASACRWSYPVGKAPEAGPAPLANQHPVGGNNLPQYGKHLGADFWSVGGGCADLGTPVRAAADGVVVEAIDNLGSYLDVVVIRHDDAELGNVYTMYGHIARANAVTKGASVTRGQQLGTIADVRAYFSPCHLHFEILSQESFASGPFCSGCQAAGFHVSPGYDQKRGVTDGTHPATGDPFIEVADTVSQNRWYLTDPFLKRRMTRPCGAPGEDGGTTPDATSPEAGKGDPPAKVSSSGGPSGGGRADDDTSTSGCSVGFAASPNAAPALALAFVLMRTARRKRWHRR